MLIWFCHSELLLTMFIVQYYEDSSCQSLSQTRLNTADSFLVEITV